MVHVWGADQEYAATLRKGGLSYSDIQGRLAGVDRSRFKLINVPTADTIRYQLNKRALLGKELRRCRMMSWRPITRL